MSRLPFSIFVLLAIALVADLAATLSSLPEPVATHFDGAGKPDGWMTPSDYATFMIAFGVGLPLAIMGLIETAGRWFPTRLNLPNRLHWLAPERREDTVRFLRWHSGGWRI